MSQRALPSILVVEDDLDLRQTIVASLESNGFAARRPPTPPTPSSGCVPLHDGLVVDLRLPDADGMTALDEALDRYPEIRAIVMTGFGGVAEAVAAIKRGAVDFLIKPFQLSQLSRVLHAGLEQQRLREENGAQGAAERQVQIREHHRPAQHDAGALHDARTGVADEQHALIHGETGTGKELIARTIHHNSPRANERFVAFNAAAIPETLAEAELFGHVKGAFTGAVNSRAGRFELAHRARCSSTKWSMSLPLQAKLLRALQEREIERVGESRPLRLDIRVIAATNTDLRKLVKDGTFRDDLFYRLNVIPVTMPALRQRREDIPLLAQHFVRKSCTENNIAIKTMTQDALRALMAYDWPGNIRQFENAVSTPWRWLRRNRRSAPKRFPMTYASARDQCWFRRLRFPMKD